MGAAQTSSVAQAQPVSTSKIGVLRFLAELDADAERRHLLNGGGYVIDAAVESGLVANDEASMSAFTEAIDDLVAEGAIRLTDDYLERRRPGEVLTPSQFYNCRNLKITLRGYEVINSLQLLVNRDSRQPAPQRRRRRYYYDRGAEFGRWTLVGQLGSGGNGEVWEASDDDSGELVAIKILHAESVDDERYVRFRREIETLLSLGPEDGVLPLIDFDLPESPHERPAWYTMPVARSLRVALGGKPLAEQVAASRDVGVVLARLADRGIHHRDVKPENLYFYAGSYVLGDFGLVRRHEDEKLTLPGKFPGPFAYLPNEAILQWHDADFEKVDVFCLAKTLWVLAANEDIPPRGRLNASDLYALARRLIDEPYVDELDELIQHATLDDPSQRLSLNEFVRRLTNWLEARELRLNTVQKEPIRNSLDVITKPGLVPDSRASEWLAESTARFSQVSADHATYDQPRPFPHGFLEFAYVLNGSFAPPSLKDLRDVVSQARSRWNGWPLWLVLPDEPPYPIDNTIECWLGTGTNLETLGPSSNDYWRASPDGRLYIARGYEDDDPGREPGKTLEVGIVLWRAAEGLLHARRLAHLLAADDSAVTFVARWGGLKGRHLGTWAQPSRVPFSTDYVSRQETVTASVTAEVSRIEPDLIRLVRELTQPLYETFAFFTPADSLFEGEVGKVLAHERSTV